MGIYLSMHFFRNDKLCNGFNFPSLGIDDKPLLHRLQRHNFVNFEHGESSSRILGCERDHGSQNNDRILCSSSLRDWKSSISQGRKDRQNGGGRVKPAKASQGFQGMIVDSPW